MSTRKIVLGKPSDWDTCISFVRTRAENNNIWKLVNPELTEKPASLSEPVTPTYDQATDDEQFDPKKYEAYKARVQVYKMELAKFDRQQKAFGDLIFWLPLPGHHFSLVGHHQSLSWTPPP